MEMIELLGSENLKLPYENKYGIGKLLKSKYDEFLKELKAFSRECKSESMEMAIKKIELSTKGIIESIHKYLSGDIIGAGNTFYGIVEQNETSIKKISDYYDKYVFRTYYKARIEKDKVIESKEDIFHIPFESRYLVKNQRYSVSGFPCIYLGATPYTCYEELGRPKEKHMYFTKVEIPKTYKFITIGLLPYELKKRLQGNSGNEDIIINYLEMLPIIMACSVKVDESKRGGAFKEEYIIPQLITQWLVTSERSYDGILYFSTATRTYSRYNYRLYQNLVIPVKEIKTSGYCPKLLKEIKLTKPISAKGITFLKEYKFKKFPQCGKLGGSFNGGRISVNDTKEIHYSSSGFRLLECKLSKKRCSVIKRLV